MYFWVVPRSNPRDEHVLRYMYKQEQGEGKTDTPYRRLTLQALSGFSFRYDGKNNMQKARGKQEQKFVKAGGVDDSSRTFSSSDQEVEFVFGFGEYFWHFQVLRAIYSCSTNTLCCIFS